MIARLWDLLSAVVRQATCRHVWVFAGRTALATEERCHRCGGERHERHAEVRP